MDPSPACSTRATRSPHREQDPPEPDFPSAADSRLALAQSWQKTCLQGIILP